MNLTNEDRELLDRHFEQDLTEPETALLQQKLAEDETFRQAFRLRELIHERIQVQGAAQLKATLKAQLAAQRSGAEEKTARETPVRSLLGTPLRWAVAASVGVVAAAALFFTLRNDPDEPVSVTAQDTVTTERPAIQQPPTYAGTDTYSTAYPIATDQTQRVAHAVLLIDETRTDAAYRLGTDTLFVYYPQGITTEILTLKDSANALLLQIDKDRYQLDPAVVTDTEQPLLPIR